MGNGKKGGEPPSRGVFQKRIQEGTPPPCDPISGHPRSLLHRPRPQHVLAHQVMPLLVLEHDRLELLPALVDQNVDDAGVGDRRPRFKQSRDVAAERCRGGHVLEAVVLDGPGDETADLLSAMVVVVVEKVEVVRTGGGERMKRGRGRG